MRNSPIILAAFAFALLTALWVYFSGAEEAPDLRPTVVAVVEIPPGVPITESQVRILQWPKKLLPVGSFEKKELVVGRVARQLLAVNEPVVDIRLASRNAKGGLSSLIAAGKRAISVRVDEVIGVAGFALPGSFVDVMVSTRDASSTPFSKIVLSRVKVVATEQSTASDPTQPKVVRAVTLELTPGDAEILDLARSIGSLSLVLRNEADSGQTASTGARLNDIMPGAENKASEFAVSNLSKNAQSVGAPRASAGVSAPAKNAANPRANYARNRYGAEEIRGGSSSSGNIK